MAALRFIRKATLSEMNRSVVNMGNFLCGESGNVEMRRLKNREYISKTRLFSHLTAAWLCYSEFFFRCNRNLCE